MPEMHFTKEQIDQIGRIAGLMSKLQDRCDAFLERRARHDAEKASRKADKAQRRADQFAEAEKALKAPAAPLAMPDTHLPSEREELRTGALSKRNQ